MKVDKPTMPAGYNGFVHNNIGCNATRISRQVSNRRLKDFIFLSWTEQ